jgi:hypothetical protein
MKFAVLAALLSSAAAFSPAKSAARTSAVQMGYETEVGVIAPTGFFDPLGLSSNIDQDTFDAYRAAELKVRGETVLFPRSQQMLMTSLSNALLRFYSTAVLPSFALLDMLSLSSSDSLSTSPKDFLAPMFQTVSLPLKPSLPSAGHKCSSSLVPLTTTGFLGELQARKARLGP